MIYRGKIELIDNDNIHVSISDFFSPFFENKLGYPIASISYPLIGDSEVGFFETLKVGLNVWIMLEKNDKRKPIIVGIIKEVHDFPIMNEDDIIKIINKKYGITLTNKDNNVDMLFEGDITIPIGNWEEKKLFDQINDMNEAIVQLQNIVTELTGRYNIHTHSVIGSSTLIPSTIFNLPSLLYSFYKKFIRRK